MEKKSGPWGGGGGESGRGGEKKEMEKGKDKIFSVFRRLELDYPRTKVGPRNESYA